MVKEQASNEKIAAYKDTTKAEMEPYAQDFNAIIEGYEENMVVGFYSEGTIGAKKSVNINLLPERRSLRMCLSTSQRIQPASSTVLITRF